MFALMLRLPVDVPVRAKDPVPQTEGNAEVMVPHLALVVQVVDRFIEPEYQVRIIMLHLVCIGSNTCIDETAYSPACSGGYRIQKTEP